MEPVAREFEVWVRLTPGRNTMTGSGWELWGFAADYDAARDLLRGANVTLDGAVEEHRFVLVATCR